MCDIERKGRKDDHDTFETDEKTLVVNQRSGVAIAELVDTIGATDEDEENGEGHEGHKDLELPGHGGFGDGGAAAEANGVVGSEANKDDQSDDLEGKTSKSHVDSNL